MARPEDVCSGGRYKRWKPWSMGDYYHTIAPAEITPMPGSIIRLNDVMTVNIVDDIGVYGGGGITMVYYLYDFIKEGRVTTKEQYIIKKEKDVNKTVYYDEGLDEKLGGDKEKIGGL